MISVVRVTVVSVATHCPFYRSGDRWLIKQQCFDPSWAGPKQFCVHGLVDIYDAYMEIRRGPVGGRKRVGCRDQGIVTFEIERLPDEEAPGWN